MSGAELLALVAALLLSAGLLPVAIRVSKRLNLVDQPGGRKRHKTPTPFVGGLVLFISTWVTVFVAAQVFPGQFAPSGATMLYVFLGATLILALGFVDDIRPLPAWVKLIAQVAVGLLLFAGGIRVELLTTPYGSMELQTASVFITVAWVVGLTNAINLIDGLDGLAAGVCLIAALPMVVIGRFHEVGWVMILIWAMIGFLVPFWFHNRYPARTFLGDSGSMQLGYYFAVFSLLVRFKSFTLSALFVPLLTLGVPITEAATSLLRRLISGRSVMKADRRHLFHYLALLGLSPGQVVGVFYGLGMVFGLCAVAMFLTDRVLVLGLLSVFMVVIFAVFFILVGGLSRRARQGSAELRRNIGKNHRSG